MDHPRPHATGFRVEEYERGGGGGAKGQVQSSSYIVGFLRWRGFSLVAGLFPVGRRSGLAAPLFPISSNGAASISSSSIAASGATESSPMGGFTSHGVGGFTKTTYTPPARFRSLHLHLRVSWWDSDATSPLAFSFQRSDPTWYAFFFFLVIRRERDLILVIYFLNLKLKQFIELF